MYTENLSPLRYPGGKAKLFEEIKKVIVNNRLTRRIYVEPFAGGAGLALALLETGVVRSIHINDYDRSIYAFWYSVMNETEEMVRRIMDVELSVEEWRRQKNIQAIKADAPLIDLGFSTLYLNRTNRSGILSGGVMGGVDQNGDYLIDCRFNRLEIVRRVLQVARHKTKIRLSNLDALTLLEKLHTKSSDCFIYLDPPYYQKGNSLYLNYYKHDDHQTLVNYLRTSKFNYIVSYDDCEAIRKLYKGFKSRSYSLNHSVSNKGTGQEIMYFTKRIRIPRMMLKEKRS